MTTMETVTSLEGARYERVNDIGSVSIRLASPTDIRNWSYGEVRKPETISNCTPSVSAC